jgi:NTP pyrophosphatase (non-canonical NTP hydrolase)
LGDLTLRQLQAEHKLWLEHNFPEYSPARALMGVMEEVGELAHAQLKGEQQIRTGLHTEANARAKMDAVGDIIIFLTGYCTESSLDFQHCLEVTWAKVKQRDWIADPEGVTAT